MTLEERMNVDEIRKYASALVAISPKPWFVPRRWLIKYVEDLAARAYMAVFIQ